MNVSEVIEVLSNLKEEHGDVEVRKLKRFDYLVPIFKGSIIYNSQTNMIEI